MPPETKAEILLSTYNGERFLPELLASLDAQSFKGVRLLARDDGSTDGSAGLLARFAETASFPCETLPSSGRRLGVLGSFNALAAASTAPYVLFCDQDDVWLPEKTEKSLQAVQELERLLGEGVPALAHCDLAVVDERLSPLRPSMWDAQRLDAMKRTGLAAALVQNAATGCAAIANRALAEAAFPVPEEAIMHDWHLAIVAAALGGVKPIPERLILYRQHSANAVGFLDCAGLPSLFSRKALARALAAPERLAPLFRQAAAARRALDGKLPQASKEVFDAFLAIPRQGWLSRRASLLRHGFLKSGLARNAGLMLFI